MIQPFFSVIGTKITDTTFKSSFPRKNVTPYQTIRGRESIFGHCRQPSDLGGTNAHFHPSVCRQQGCMDDSSENSLCSTAHPSFRRRACPVPRYGAGIQSPVPANTRLSTERLSPFSSSMVPVATGMAHCYENRLRQTRRRGNPCGCPFPAPTRFHPLMWPLQGHGHSEKRSDEESTISPSPG